MAPIDLEGVRFVCKVQSVAANSYAELRVLRLLVIVQGDLDLIVVGQVT